MCFACYQLLSATGISETLGKWAEVHLGKDKFKMRMKVDIVLCLLLMDYEEALQECAPSKISTCKQLTAGNVLMLISRKCFTMFPSALPLNKSLINCTHQLM